MAEAQGRRFVLHANAMRVSEIQFWRAPEMTASCDTQPWKLEYAKENGTACWMYRLGLSYSVSVSSAACSLVVVRCGGMGEGWPHHKQKTWLGRNESRLSIQSGRIHTCKYLTMDRTRDGALCSKTRSDLSYRLVPNWQKLYLSFQIQSLAGSLGLLLNRSSHSDISSYLPLGTWRALGF